MLTPSSERDGARLNVDEDRGQTRFYGPTSQEYIHLRGRPASRGFSDTSTQGATGVNMDSDPVRNHLLQIYWRAHTLSVVVVEYDAFETGRKAVRRSEWYSTFLESSLLACATRMSTSAELRALGARYADRAMSEIIQELQNPNIATLQGLLSLSDFEATRGRDRLGYMYSGVCDSRLSAILNRLTIVKVWPAAWFSILACKKAAPVLSLKGSFRHRKRTLATRFSLQPTCMTNCGASTLDGRVSFPTLF